MIPRGSEVPLLTVAFQGKEITGPCISLTNGNLAWHEGIEIMIELTTAF